MTEINRLADTGHRMNADGDRENALTESEQKYSDIIHLTHPVSKTHPQMPLYDRAAQFSPFAALTGHEAAIKETERVTEQWMPLEEDKKEELNRKLQQLMQFPTERKNVTITFFQPDKKKEGGAYVTVTGQVKKIDTYEQQIIFKDGTKIKLDRITEIEVMN